MTLPPLLASVQTFTSTEPDLTLGFILVALTLIPAVIGILLFVSAPLDGPPPAKRLGATMFIGVVTLSAGLAQFVGADDRADEALVANIQTARPDVAQVELLEDSRALLTTEQGTEFEVIVEEDPETFEPSFTVVEQGSAEDFEQLGE